VTGREARFDGPPDSYWTPPDDVDVILAQERFEESDDFADAVREWMTQSALVFDHAADLFPTTTAYDRAFTRWMEAGGR